MKHFVPLFTACLGLLVLPRAEGALVARTLNGVDGEAHLVSSSLKVSVGAQWIDVEEEIELKAVPTWSESIGPWLVEGTFNVPAGSVLTGCLLWNNDTLLMGKLRGKADAQQRFDSLVPTRPPAWPRDPLLLEQISDTVYGLKLYPFASNGVRKFRIRYLVPVTSHDGSISLQPLLLGAVSSVPPTWELALRGNATGVKLKQDGAIWPLNLPSDRQVSTSNGAVSLLWSAGNAAKRALRGSIGDGSWKGDYVLYSGEIPDSISRRAILRSETVVLWRWIQPSSFFSNCGYYDNSPRCLSGNGVQALEQARSIGRIADRLTERGGRVGLVADQGLDDTAKVFPIAGARDADFVRMRDWLDRIDMEYLAWRIPAQAPGSGGVVNLELSRNRDRFRTDIRKVGALYSKELGIIRHVLVVTVGRVPSGGDYMEEPDLRDLPSDVSLSSSILAQGYGYFNPYTGYYETQRTPASWPGVDLVSAEAHRPGDTTTVEENGVRLPQTRLNFAATISMDADGSKLVRNVVMERDSEGHYFTTFNAQAKKLGTTLQWSVFDAHGDTLQSWTVSPQWLDVKGDSAVPRIWAKSTDRVSTVFRTGSLAPVFGFVDTRYSLLALPTDTVGRVRQALLADSGVPFLTAQEIFPEIGYKLGGDPAGIAQRTPKADPLHARLLAGRIVRIELAGLNARGLEILDLRGRVVARWSAAELRGLGSVDWNGRDLTGSAVSRGMYLLRATLANEVRSATVAMP